jgi:hypothetical protein
MDTINPTNTIITTSASLSVAYITLHFYFKYRKVKADSIPKHHGSKGLSLLALSTI